MSVQDSHSSVFRKLAFCCVVLKNLHILVHFVGFACILPEVEQPVAGSFFHSSLRPGGQAGRWLRWNIHGSTNASGDLELIAAQDIDGWQHSALCLNLGRKKIKWR